MEETNDLGLDLTGTLLNASCNSSSSSSASLSVQECFPPPIDLSPRAIRSNKIFSFPSRNTNYPISLRSRIPHRVLKTTSSTATSNDSPFSFFSPSYVSGSQSVRRSIYDTPRMTLSSKNKNYSRCIADDPEKETVVLSSAAATLSPTRPKGHSRRRGHFGRSSLYELTTVSTGNSKKASIPSSSSTSDPTSAKPKSSTEGQFLQHHSIHEPSYITDERFLSMLDEKGIHIKELDLSDLGWLSSYSLSFIGKLCLQLERINFYNCIRMNDSILNNIANNCPSLRSISMNSLNDINSGASMMNMFQKCQQLQHLNIDGLNNSLLIEKDALLIEKEEEKEDPADQQENDSLFSLLDLEEHHVTSATQFLWIVFAIVEQEIEIRRVSGQRGKQNENDGDDDDEEEINNMMNVLQFLFLFNEDDEEAEVENTFYDLYLYITSMDNSNSNSYRCIDESEVRYIYGHFIINNETDDRMTTAEYLLSTQMSPTEMELYTKKFRKPRGKSSKKKKGNRNNNNNVLPSGGKIRELRTEIVQTISKRMSSHNVLHDDDTGRRNTTDTKYQYFIKGLKYILQKNKNGRSSVLPEDGNRKEEQVQSFLYYLNCINMKELHLTNMKTLDEKHFHQLGKLKTEKKMYIVTIKNTSTNYSHHYFVFI
jgi:hypothetical protein